MPVPVPGPEFGSDSQKVKFFDDFRSAENRVFWPNFRGPGVHSPNSRFKVRSLNKQIFLQGQLLAHGAQQELRK